MLKSFDTIVLATTRIFINICAPLLLSQLGLVLISPTPEAVAQPSNRDRSDGGFGRGGLDLGWGNPEEDDDGKAKATPTPTPTPKKKDDSFFNNNVEDTGQGDKL